MIWQHIHDRCDIVSTIAFIGLLLSFLKVISSDIKNAFKRKIHAQDDGVDYEKDEPNE